MEIILIAAIGENGEMGHNNELLWHLPGDLPRFKQLTMGSPIIMGRKTFDSIGRALPGRLNIVLTENSEWQADGVTVANSIHAALELANEADTGRAFVIGGGQIYKLFLAYATKLELTEVYDTPVADTYFPLFSSNDFVEVQREKIIDKEPAFDYVTYQRV
ncbi:dihydrofolate reductase [Arenicella chitinivorans]|uniref:Dihydrofolate reductase n=1 Tax=Arenicella chitinivorans TaxID=1329800 RepID=A0A918VSK9_9GAMM|nr:dihydrofolate reductase [Arenicella chitinivorans]GHA19069.1 dihydrofolate reductase [Arenicella chitinivorans]